MRSVEVWEAGSESALDTFGRDLAAAAFAARSGVATCRLWRRPAPTLSAGRFHRLPCGGTGLERRLTGGRIVPLGPQVLACTLVAPSASWFELGAAVGPDQVLNRALRPVLGVLRGLGVDAFYPGRDLVTVAGAPVACASFTIEPDGVVQVDQFVAVETDFTCLPELLAAADPDSVAATDTRAFAASTSLTALGVQPPDRGWASALAGELARSFACSVDVAVGEPGWWRHTLAADRACHEAFREQRGRAPGGHVAVAEPTMLGVVEATADTRDGSIRALVVSGDIITRPATLEELAYACEGLRAAAPALRRVVTRVLSQPDRFVLGVRDLASLLVRLACE